MMVDVLDAMGMSFMCAHNPIKLGSGPSFRCTKLRSKPTADLFTSSCQTKGRTVGGLLLQPKHDLNNQVKRDDDDDDDDDNVMTKSNKKKRVFFLDVNPICYNGSTPSLHSFAHWISLFFSQVSLADPVIAVFDGEGGHEYRRKMLASYKAHRRKFLPWVSASSTTGRNPVNKSYELISDTLTKCNVPVVKIGGEEADDVVATLVEQVIEKGYRVVIASPDKDFKQLISENVQLVMPIPQLKRWSFYTLDHYIAQYNSHPLSDLSLRCILGDEADGVPGIQHLVPNFGMKTALKLIKKHGSLDELLDAAAVRTVGKPNIQNALTNHATFLRRNYDVLSLKRDVNIRLQEDWLLKRHTENDLEIISNFVDLLGETHSYKR